MTIAVVQARMDSRRLPGKVLADLHGKPVLEHVVDRVRDANHLIDLVAVATSTDPADDPIADLADTLETHCFRGHPTDVLDRVHEAWKSLGSDWQIVRVTADCPLLDPALIAPMLDLLPFENDYVSVHGVPSGRFCEAFTSEVLEAAHRWAFMPADREHVVPWMIRNGNADYVAVEDYPDGRDVELNTPEDLERIRAVARET